MNRNHPKRNGAAEALAFCRTFFPWRTTTEPGRAPIITAWKGIKLERCDVKPQKHGNELMWLIPSSSILRGWSAPAMHFHVPTMLTLMKQKRLKSTGDCAMYQVSENDAKRFFQVVSEFVQAGTCLGQLIRDASLENHPTCRAYLVALEAFRSEVDKYVSKQQVV